MRTLLLCAALFCAAPVAPDRSESLADAYVEAVEALNAAHAKKPKAKNEAQLRERLPKKARTALENLLELQSGDALEGSLARCARAALDVDGVEDFGRCRERLAQLDAKQAAELGAALSRERVLLLGEGGLDEDYLAHFAEVFEGVLAAYDEVFGFAEYSKVPGKKLRVRVHLEEEITRPPHFAPQYPWHSEIDFPVIDAERLRSPTADGKFLFYGLCHELGHVVAMWGSRTNEEDHHAWAHYTGVAIVEHLAGSKAPPAWLADCKDARWRSLTAERERLKDTAPGGTSRDAVLARLFALHDEVGPRAIGDAIDALDEEDERLRVNQVRYYTFPELEGALVDGTKNKKQRARIAALCE